MWIDSTYKEVECFHPVCREALEAALVKLNLDSDYEVQHHRHVGAIEMDFVIANKTTNKILCVVEVKRTTSSVNSTRCQYQAMSYVQSLTDVELESRYYLLTNLEASCLFKFDVNRPNVYEQIIEPGIVYNHRFQDVDKDKFLSDLIEQYAIFISTIKHDRGCYLLSFKRFAEEIHGKINNVFEWKKSLAALFYEYIRGSFSKINRNELRTIAQLSNRADLICREALKVNFKDIFTLSDCPPDKMVVDAGRTLLHQLFDLGRNYVDADELAGVMHKVISDEHRHEGEVPTDAELAMLMLSLAKCVSGDLQENERVLDPAAGSGTLLCAAIKVYEGINPSQLFANDINDRLLQLLSLRIGLKYASTIDKKNTARITAMNIADFPMAEFDNVKVVVMNPPFLSATGVNCISRKAELYERIRNLKVRKPTTLGGQMPLEGPFIELVSTLAKDGTIIAAILPSTHLTTKGEASRAIRTMLLDDFGLRLIFNYPQEQLFEEVSQNTSIVIGVKGNRTDNVRYLYSNEVVSEIDVSSLNNIVIETELSDDAINNIDNHFEGCVVARTRLKEMLAGGWHIGNMTKRDAQNFVRVNIATSRFLTPLSDSEYKNYQRGKVGNEGCTDMLFMDSEDPFLMQMGKRIEPHLSSGLNNAKYGNVFVGDGESRFFNVAGMTDRQIRNVVTAFKTQTVDREKKQRREKKSVEEYVKVLKKESAHVTPPYSVILPRMLRSNGRVFISDRPTYVSTNFFVIQTDDRRAPLLASWFSTIFYQLECEAYCNNRKGLRKMEKEDYEPLHVPVTDQFSEIEFQKIINTPISEFVNLRGPQVREVDEVWAEILYGGNAGEILEEARGLVPILVADREK